MYIIRLDDASEYRDQKKWSKIENLLDKYEIKPIIGIIPNNEDESMINKYDKDESFWKKAQEWQKKNWVIAMHGYNHKYISDDGGLNPIQKRSEFAGVDVEKQKKKIKLGVKAMNKNNIYPKVFFAPSHTFDNNTIVALKECSDIRIISDTISNNIYYKNDIFFIPQQSGRVRKLPLKIVTFCYHPNTMSDEDFIELENFIQKNIKKFKLLNLDKLKKRKENIFDLLLRKIYFLKKRR